MANIIKLTVFNSDLEEISCGTCRMSDEDLKNYLEKLKNRADVNEYTHDIACGVHYICIYHN